MKKHTRLPSLISHIAYHISRFASFVPRLSSSSGFTLVELLVVIVILGVLVSLGLSSFRSSQAKGRDNQRKASLRGVSQALEAYYNDYGKYPNENGIHIAACGTDGATACNWGETFTDANATVYMVKLPKDPLDTKQFDYTVCCSNTKYQLYAKLENLEDRDVPKDANGVAQYYTSTNCGGAKKCNYSVTSTNIAPDENGHDLTATE